MIVASIGRDQAYLAPGSNALRWCSSTACRAACRPFLLWRTTSAARGKRAHLVRHGHRRIALVGVSTYVTTTRRRLEGYRDAVRENGLATDPNLICLGSESPDEVASDFVSC